MLTDFTQTERRNAALNATGEALWGFQAALIASATVLTVLLTTFGAGPRLIGAIAAIEGSLIVLPQVIGLRLFHNISTRRRTLVRWHLAIPIPILFITGLLLLSPAHNHPAFMRNALPVLHAAFITGIGIIVSVWMDWLADLFRPTIRGTALGLGFAVAALCGTAGGILTGIILDTWTGVNTYAILYLVAGTIAALSFVFFGAIEDPSEGHARSAPPAFSAAEMMSRFRASLQDLNFRRYLIGRAMGAAGFAVTPFIAIHFRAPEGGALSGGTVVAAGAAMALGAAAGNLVFGSLGDRYGHRLGVIAGACMQGVVLTLLLTTTGLVFCALAYFCAGICVSSTFVSHSNILYETCPHDHRLSHITLGNTALAIPVMLGGLLSGQIVQSWGLPTLFALCLVLSLGAAVWLALLVREPRNSPAPPAANA